MVRHGPFYRDPRVVKETLALVDEDPATEVTVFCRGERGSPWFARTNLTVLTFGKPPSENAIALALQAAVFGTWVAAKIWRLRPDAVIVHSIPSWLLLMLVPLRRLGHVGTLFLDHHEPESEMLVEAGLGPSLARAYERIESRALRSSDGVIDVSAVMSRRSAQLGAGRQLVVDNCPQVFVDGDGPQRATSDLAVFGSLIQRYDLPTLRRALDRVPRRLNLVQIGQGPCALRENPAGDLVDLGYLDPPELQRHLLRCKFGFVGLAQSDFTALVSPNRLWELVSLRVPAIAATTPLIRELLQDAAIFYEGGSAESLADAIERALSMNEEQRRELGAIALARLASRSWTEQSPAFKRFVTDARSESVSVR